MAKGISAEAREDILVQAFLTCPNISEISKKTKIPRPTIYTVIHSDSFQRKYSEARNEAVTGAIAYLQENLENVQQCWSIRLLIRKCRHRSE